MKKVGIMGGTFNPIHNAHLILAQEAFDQFGLDKVLFMPTKNPPHKRNDDIASDEHRINMIVEAIKDNKNFELSTLEMDREGITYTVETLRILHQLEKDTQYYFIIGGDSLMNITSWKEPDAIFAMSTIVACARNGYRKEEIVDRLNELEMKYQTTILRLNIPIIEISSRFIREKCKLNQTIRYYVPETVFSYIKNHGLYL